MATIDTNETIKIDERGDLVFDYGTEWAEAVRQGALAWELRNLMLERSRQPRLSETIEV